MYLRDLLSPSAIRNYSSLTPDIDGVAAANIR